MKISLSSLDVLLRFSSYIFLLGLWPLHEGDICHELTFLVTETCIGATDYPSCIIYVFYFLLLADDFKEGLAENTCFELRIPAKRFKEWLTRKLTLETLMLLGFFQHGAIQMCLAIFSKILWWHRNVGKCRPTYLHFIWFGDKWPNHLKWFKGASYILKAWLGGSTKPNLANFKRLSRIGPGLYLQSRLLGKSKEFG